MSPSDHNEKRQTPRLQPFVTACQVDDGARRLRGWLTDLSLKGARVAIEQELPPVGGAVTIEVRFGRRPPARLSCRVKWAQPAPDPSETATFGVTFEGLDPERQALLRTVIEEFQQRAAAL
ncbi:MAG: PilZ domain-containing protein [Vicinamibacteria bacterium]